MSTEKRVRRSNFTELELSVLTDEVTCHTDVLFAPFSPTVTSKRKAEAWENIAEKVTAVSSTRRSGADVRKKWNELKCQIRKKAQHTKQELTKTGGGPAPTPLSDLENKVVCLIPTCQIEGIPGGIESGFCANEANSSTLNYGESKLDDVESTTSVPALPTDDIPKSCNKKSTLPKSKSPKLQTVVDLEREKLEVLHKIQRDGRDRLDVERKRLAIEERRQTVEEKRLALDEEILSLIRNRSISSPFSLSPMIKF